MKKTVMVILITLCLFVTGCSGTAGNAPGGAIEDGRITMANTFAASLRQETDDTLTRMDTKGYGMKQVETSTAYLTVTIDENGEWSVILDSNANFFRGSKEEIEQEFEDRLKELKPDLKNSYFVLYLCQGMCVGCVFVDDNKTLTDGKHEVTALPTYEDFTVNKSFPWGEKEGVTIDGLAVGTAPMLVNRHSSAASTNAAPATTEASSSKPTTIDEFVKAWHALGIEYTDENITDTTYSCVYGSLYYKLQVTQNSSNGLIINVFTNIELFDTTLENETNSMKQALWAAMMYPVLVLPEYDVLDLPDFKETLFSSENYLEYLDGYMYVDNMNVFTFERASDPTYYQFGAII